MSRPFRKLADAIQDLRWPILLLFILSTVCLSYSFRALKVDPSTETLFAKNTPAFRFYQQFKTHFGSDQLIVVAIETSNYLTPTNLHLTDVLTQKLAADPRMDRVTSLSNVLDLKHKALGVKVEPAAKGFFEGEKTIEEFQGEVMSNPLILGNLISPDGKVGAVLLRLKSKPKDPDFLKGYVSELRELLRTFPWRGVRLYAAGSPVEQYDLTDSIQRDQKVFIPSVIIFLILATFLIYRNFPSVIVAMSVVAVTLVWTFGTISLMGHPLNIINSLLGPVVMIISVTSAIHLINLFCELRPHHTSLKECISMTFEHLAVPCFLASATTVAGFLSLLLNRVPAVQSFGLCASIGTVYSFVVVMVLTPVLLPVLPFKRGCESEGTRHFFNVVLVGALEKIEFNLKWFLLWGSVGVVALALVGTTRLRIDTNLIRDLKPDSPLAAATRLIDERLAGVYSLGLTLERLDGGTIAVLETLQKTDRFNEFLESQPEITKVNSLVPLIKRVHEARTGGPSGFRLPEDAGTLKTYLERMAAQDNPDFWSFISRDFKTLRLEARMKAVGTEKGSALEDRIWEYVNKNFGGEYEVQMTGSVVLLGQMAKQLVSNQIRSLGFTFVLILLIISIFFRSFKMGLLASLPNLIPIAGLYGLMGWTGIELSTPTAMISSVSLGLIVDAAVHFLYRFRYEFEHRHHYLQALHHTYRNVGQALVVATMILVFGFASAVFASFRPTIYFGLLTSLTILFALLCTLVILPLAIIFLKPFGRPSLFQAHP